MAICTGIIAPFSANSGALIVISLDGMGDIHMTLYASSKLAASKAGTPVKAVPETGEALGVVGAVVVAVVLTLAALVAGATAVVLAELAVVGITGDVDGAVVTVVALLLVGAGVTGVVGVLVVEGAGATVLTSSA